MSTLSLASSLLITAVLRGPSISHMSMFKPVAIIRTIQLPNLRAGLFRLALSVGEGIVVHLSATHAPTQDR